MTAIFRLGFLFVVAVTIYFCLQSEGFTQERRRGGFDAAEYMKRLDRNRNGILETDEMVGRTANYLQDLGFNPSEPIAISKIAEKINGKDKSDDQKSKRGEVVIKVPGFGVDTEKKGVADFSSTGATSEESLEKKYGKEVLEQVDRTMQRYDRNRDGSLDADEIKRARWGRPTPQESDLNRDGALSKAELAHRYSAREREERDQARAAEARARRDASRNPSRSRVVSSRTTTPPRVATTRSASRDPNSGSDRYRRYAQGLIKQYDKNKDGRIDKEEMSKMRRAPEGADINNDGFVTEQELADVLSGKSNTNTAAATATAKLAEERAIESPRSSSRNRGPSSSSSSRSPSKRSVSFSGNDKNGDGQLQMSEYSDEWDGDILAEFDRIDRNRDGVITAKEWAKKDQ